MAALEEHFYHKSIRTYTAAFGTIFNNIKLVRPNGKTIKVPLSYSSRQRFDIKQKYEVDDAHYKVKFPRIGFVLTNWQRDTTRIQNKRHNIYQQGVDKTVVNSVGKQLNRVPYKFFYQVTVGTKNLDDMFQIVEQIAAWFNPSLDIQISENPDLGIETSINVKMVDTGLTDDYEGSMEDEKVLISTFDFEVEGFLYMPSGNQGVIQKVCINYYDLDTSLKFESESECYPEEEPPQPVVGTCGDDISPLCPVVANNYYDEATAQDVSFIDAFSPVYTLGEGE